MEYEYNKRRFDGTRTEIVKKLKVYLSNQELTWSLGAWHLCNEHLAIGYGPEEAKKSIIDIVLLRVPRRYFSKVMPLKMLKS